MITENFQEHLNTAWIENLAQEEVSMEESGVIIFDEHLNLQKQLEISSIEFMKKLRDRFEFYASRFNSHRGVKNDSSNIRIFKISNTLCDFMLFRNSLKLIIAKTDAQTISVGFLSNSGGLFSARMDQNTPALNAPHILKAHIGPFSNIVWKYHEEDVNLESLVRHYLTEFIKHSAR